VKIRAYVRLSKDELLTYSPQTQRNQILARARSLGIPEQDIVWYEDIGVSGYTKGDEMARERFSDMLLEVQPGDEVWAVSSDRFARDVRVFQKVIEDLQDRGVKVVLFDMPLDFSRPTQRSTALWKQVGDQYYRDIISEKVQSAVPTVRAKKVRWGRWPELFEVVLDESGRRVVQPSRKAREILMDAANERIGPGKAARKHGIPYIKLWRLRKAYEEWQRTKPWYTSERYEEKKKEYEALKRLRRSSGY